MHEVSGPDQWEGQLESSALLQQRHPQAEANACLPLVQLGGAIQHQQSCGK